MTRFIVASKIVSDSGGFCLFLQALQRRRLLFQQLPVGKLCFLITVVAIFVPPSGFVWFAALRHCSVLLDKAAMQSSACVLKPHIAVKLAAVNIE